MAIDPNIALQFQGPQIDVARDVVSAATAKKALVDAAVAQRNLDIQKWAGTNAPNFLSTDQQGNPKFDVVNASTEAAKLGYADAIPHIAQEYITNQQGQIANATSQIDQQQLLFKAGKDTAGMVGVHVLSTPENLRLNDYNNLKGMAIKQFGTNISPFFPDLNTPDDVTNFAKEATKTTMTPMQQGELQNSTTYANIAAHNQIAQGADAAGVANNARDMANRFNIGADSITNLPPGYGAALQDPAKWATYIANLSPAVRDNAAQVKQALDLHKQAGRPDLNLNIGGDEAIAGILRADAAYQNAQSGVATNKAKELGYTSKPNSTVPPVTPTPTPKPKTPNYKTQPSSADIQELMANPSTQTKNRFKNYFGDLPPGVN